MENTNLKIKFKLAAILFILNTLSNDIIKNLLDILDIKMLDKENKIENINHIIDFLKSKKDKDIEEFQIILKQVNPNNNTILYEIKDTNNDENNKINIFGASESNIYPNKSLSQNNECNNPINNNITKNNYKKKRNYIKMLEDSKNIESKDNINITQSEGVKNKNYNRQFYPKYLKDNKEKHYYYNDNNNKEWEFLEIQDSKNNYYFKCSTGICKGFGMIERKMKKNYLN